MFLRRKSPNDEDSPQRRAKKKLIPAPEICVRHGSRIQAFLK
jgi:hypothetical protein